MWNLWRCRGKDNWAMNFYNNERPQFALNKKPPALYRRLINCFFSCTLNGVQIIRNFLFAVIIQCHFKFCFFFLKKTNWKEIIVFKKWMLIRISIHIFTCWCVLNCLWTIRIHSHKVWDKTNRRRGPVTISVRISKINSPRSSFWISVIIQAWAETPLKFRIWNNRPLLDLNSLWMASR